jgi:hypothetical protein
MTSVASVNQRLSARFLFRWAIVYDEANSESLEPDYIKRAFETLWQRDRRTNVYVFKHDPVAEAPSKHPFRHYHIMFVMESGSRFDNVLRFIRNWANQEKLQFDTEAVKWPFNAVAYLHLPGKEEVFRSEQFHPDLLDEIKGNVLWDEAYASCMNRVSNRQSVWACTGELNKQAQAIREMATYMRDARSTDLRRLQQVYATEDQFVNIVASRNFQHVFDMARMFAAAQIQMESLEDLSNRWEEHPVPGERGYMEVDQSIRVVFRLAEAWDMNPFCLILYIWMVANRMLPKINTLQLVGDANSGKSFLLNSVARMAGLAGEIHRGDNNRTFVYQDAVDSRLIIMNEPSFEHGPAFQLLEVLEGKATQIDVKYQKAVTLVPTPVFISGNTPVWAGCLSHEAAIKKRCISITTKTASFLKDVTKDLNPKWFGACIAAFGPKLLKWKEYWNPELNIVILPQQVPEDRVLSRSLTGLSCFEHLRTQEQPRRQDTTSETPSSSSPKRSQRTIQSYFQGDLCATSSTKSAQTPITSSTIGGLYEAVGNITTYFQNLEADEEPILGRTWQDYLKYLHVPKTHSGETDARFIGTQRFVERTILDVGTLHTNCTQIVKLALVVDEFEPPGVHPSQYENLKAQERCVVPNCTEAHCCGCWAHGLCGERSTKSPFFNRNEIHDEFIFSERGGTPIRQQDLVKMDQALRKRKPNAGSSTVDETGDGPWQPGAITPVSFLKQKKLSAVHGPSQVPNEPLPSTSRQAQVEMTSLDPVDDFPPLSPSTLDFFLNLP